MGLASDSPASFPFSAAKLAASPRFCNPISRRRAERRRRGARGGAKGSYSKRSRGAMGDGRALLALSTSYSSLFSLSSLSLPLPLHCNSARRRRNGCGLRRGHPKEYALTFIEFCANMSQRVQPTNILLPTAMINLCLHAKEIELLSGL
uniref:Uncharacterized protein n=1 Tax=Oryza nivara TaxID=4536 RepID=A0A0E0IXE6_ORYNI